MKRGMHGLKGVVLVAVWLSSVVSVRAATVNGLTLTLSTPGTYNRLNLEITADTDYGDSSDTDTTNVTGTMLGDLQLTYDAASRAANVTGLYFHEQNPGQVSMTPMSFTLSFVGGLFHEYINSRTILGTPLTPTAWGAVNGGAVDMTQQEFEFNSGSITWSGLTSGSQVLNGQPIILTPPAGSPSGTLTVTKTAGDTWTQSAYSVTLLSPLSFNELVTSGSNPINYQIWMSGAGSGNYAGTLQSTSSFTQSFTPTAGYWNTSGASGLQAGNGTWDAATTANWSPTTAGGSPLLTWYSGGSTIDAVFYASGTSTVTVSGTVAANSLVFDGTGYTLTGNTAAAVALTSGAITVNQNATVNVTLALSAGLTVYGSATLTLGGSNTYTGGTTLAGGTLRLGSSAAIGSSGAISFTGGTLMFSGSNTTDYSPRFSTAANQAYSINPGGQSVTLGTALTSAGGSLTTLGAGTLTLTANATYSGATTINTGTLQLGNGGTTGAVAGAVVDNGVLAFNRSNAVTFGGLISGSGSVWQTGSGTLTLSGNNTYNGGATVSAGWLCYNTATALGTGLLTLSGGTLCDSHGTAWGSSSYGPANTIFVTAGQNTRFTASNANGAVTDSYLSGSLTGSGSLTISTTANFLWLSGNNAAFAGTLINQAISNCLIFGGTATGSGSATWVINANARAYTTVGTVALGALAGTSTSAQLSSQTSSTVTYAVGALGASTTYAGVICDGSGEPVSLVKLGAGTLTLTGGNSYTGGSTITGGALQIGNGGVSGSISGAVVDNALLVFNRSGASTFSRAISGSGTMNYLGSGTLTLTGGNSYSGGTNIAGGGTLQIGDGTTTGCALAGTVNTGAGTLAFNCPDAVTLSGAVSGSGAVTQFGSGTVTLAAANSYTGGATLSAGCLIYGNATSFGTGTLTLSGGTLAEGANLLILNNAILVNPGNNTYVTVSNGAYTDIKLGGSLTGGGSLTVATPANYVWLLGNDSAFSGTFINQSINNSLILDGVNSGSGSATWVINANARAYATVGTIAFGALSGTSASAQLASQSSSTVTYAIGALNTSTTYAGHIYDATGGTAAGLKVGVLKVGAGSLTLTGSSLYTGGTTLNGGTLQIGNGIATGCSLAGAINTGDLTNGAGTLAFNCPDAVAFSGVISGAGAVTQLGSGTSTLSQTNSYTGLTTINAGVLAYGAAGATGPGNLSVSVGTLNLGVYSGTSAAVTLNSGAILGAGTLTSTAGFTVSSGSISAVLAGSVGLTKSTANTVTLSGANVYTGTSYVNAGALVIQGAATAAVLASTATTDISAGQLVFSYSGSSTGASIASQVQSILAASYNGGTNSWAFGVIHSALANTHSTGSYALGWTNNTVTSAVTVKVVLYGDANLDGTVNINDLSKVLGNYNKSGMTWADGDFNYDGTVNINDLSKVLGNYNRSLVLTGTDISTSEYPNLDGQAIAALEAAGITVVPEPGTLALLTAGAIGLLAYRWRRRRAM